MFCLPKIVEMSDSDELLRFYQRFNRIQRAKIENITETLTTNKNEKMQTKQTLYKSKALFWRNLIALALGLSPSPRVHKKEERAGKHTE